MKSGKTFLFIILLSTLGFSQALIQGFKSDGCTNSPGGTWKHCCYEHDFLYWVGGSFVERKYADDKLKWCMNNSGGPGHLYYEFVRAAGTQFWSSAWKNQNMKTNLSQKEKLLIAQEKSVWMSLGRPRNFEFKNAETIIFPQMTQQQYLIIKNEMAKKRMTKEYQNFLSIYKQRMKRLPDTERF